MVSCTPVWHDESGAKEDAVLTNAAPQVQLQQASRHAGPVLPLFSRACLSEPRCPSTRDYTAGQEMLGRRSLLSPALRPRACFRRYRWPATRDPSSVYPGQCRGACRRRGLAVGSRAARPKGSISLWRDAARGGPAPGAVVHGGGDGLSRWALAGNFEVMFADEEGSPEVGAQIDGEVKCSTEDLGVPVVSNVSGMARAQSLQP
jgi:hypothetical protein